jgi:hypothetical protein
MSDFQKRAQLTESASIGQCLLTIFAAAAKRLA